MLLAGVFVLEMSLIAVLVLALIPIVYPAASADMADLLRSIIGPKPVSTIESVSFQIQDEINYLYSKIDGGQIQITLSNPSQDLIIPTNTISPASTPTQLVALATSIAKNNKTPAILATATPTPIPPALVVVDSPQIGWQAYGPSVNGQPAMARTLVELDPERPYAGIALVRIDLSKLQIHMMPGYLEPPHPDQILQAIPSLGMIPNVDQIKLVAAFNGGFKDIHGHYGMMTAGVTLTEPKPGLATIAIYKDDRLQIGIWAVSMLPSPDMIAFRQNCPPLIQFGQINPAISKGTNSAWGFTDNKDITWRTGLGLTFDNRYLIYAMGNGTSAETLARAMQLGGAFNAMQLDIHQPYVHFVTYQSNDPISDSLNLTALPLIDQKGDSQYLYLTPHSRDFFYLTAR